ncbi:unnamed protein product [Durusdinium trenchii]|uniref:Ankyrin repeat domain-containing protein n=1 Tax=Durusdinium trenchii TaxID=1381693 RepID=A0ABP0QAV4_9DINO
MAAMALKKILLLVGVLQVAAQYYSASMRRLQESGVDVAQLASDFHKACQRGDQDAASALLLKGVDVNDVSASGPEWSALAQAVIRKDTTMCTWLLSKGASPDTPDRRGRTPLYHAVSNQLSTVVTEMLKTAKDLSPSDGDGIDLLTRAVWVGNADIVKSLLASGASSEAAQFAAQSAPTAIALLFGHSGVTKPSPAPAVAPTPAPAVVPAPAPVTETVETPEEAETPAETVEAP